MNVKGLAISKLPTNLSQATAQIISAIDPAAPQTSWMKWVGLVRQHQVPVAVYDEVWQNIFGRQEHFGTPMWWPEQEVVQQANLTRWMSDLGCDTYRQLHQWSVTQRATFWRKVVEELNVSFAQPPEQILDDTHGPQRARWLPGARLNIVDTCFQAPAGRSAITFQRPGQPIEHMTYEQLACLTNRVSNGLVNAGLEPGDAVAVVLPMTALSVPIYLGIVQAGCVVVSIADSFAAPEIANRLRIAHAKLVLTYDWLNRSGKTIPLYRRVAEATELPVVVLPAEDRVMVTLRSQDRAWSSFLGTQDEFTPVICDAHDTINVLFSSGTTGDPKAIPWDHLTPIKCAADGLFHQDIHPGEVIVWPTNLGWMMGPWLIFASLINRATIGLYEDVPMGPKFGRFIQDAGVTMLGVVPTIVRAWRESRCMEELDWSAVHCFSSTGEASSADDMFYLSSLAGIKPIVEYCGGTEIGGGYITSTVVQPNVPGAFTTPAMGLDLVILDSRGSLADDGELFIVPPSIGLSSRLLNRDHYQTYYGDVPNAPGGRSLRRHGDHMRHLGERIYVAGGRVDDTMNLGGIKISSAEIERVLNLIDGVRETAAVAVSGEHGPEQLAVFAVVDGEVDAENLRKMMNARIKEQLNPLFKVTRLELIDALPRTASNKVMRRRLRDQLESR